MADPVTRDPVTRIKELDAERSKLIETAKKEAFARAEAAVKDLNDLGFEYRLVTGARKISKKGVVPDKACPICGFRTSPPHDRRRHRHSKAKRRPFNAAELKEFGLKKI
jgi:hypothetical protein